MSRQCNDVGMDDTTLPSFPEGDGKDLVQATVRGGLGLVPFAGQALAELLDIVVQPSFDRRLEQWGREVDQLVEELKLNSVTPEDLAGNEEWISALAKATQVAASTHLGSKLQMLKRILSSSVLSIDVDHAVVKRMMKFVEDLEPVHFRLLGVANDPRAFLDSRGIDLSALTLAELTADPTVSSVSAARSRELVHDCIRTDLDLLEVHFEMLWSDIVSAQLVQPPDEAKSDVVEATMASWLSPLGQELLAWVGNVEFEGG